LFSFSPKPARLHLAQCVFVDQLAHSGLPPSSRTRAAPLRHSPSLAALSQPVEYKLKCRVSPSFLPLNLCCPIASPSSNQRVNGAPLMAMVPLWIPSALHPLRPYKRRHHLIHSLLELILPPVPPLHVPIAAASSFTGRWLCPLSSAHLRHCSGPWSPRWEPPPSPLRFQAITVSSGSPQRPQVLTPVRALPTLATGPRWTRKSSSWIFLLKNNSNSSLILETCTEAHVLFVNSNLTPGFEFLI
jgi:hypothetical protein